MVIHRSVLKRARQNIKLNLANNSAKSAVKTAMKKVHSAVKEENVEAVKMSLNNAFSLLEKAASRRIIHKNTVARKKSKLNIFANKVLLKTS